MILHHHLILLMFHYLQYNHLGLRIHHLKIQVFVQQYMINFHCLHRCLKMLFGLHLLLLDIFPLPLIAVVEEDLAEDAVEDRLEDELRVLEGD